MTTQAPSIPYQASPAVIVNEAIDMLGESGRIIGDITDGTAVAEAARRFYGQGLRQLLRTAHWDFARKMVTLQLLGDSTGTSAAPISTFVENPWTYCYAWPTDAVQGRWLPWNPTTAQPLTNTGVPLTTGVSTGVQYSLAPGRFLVGSSDQYPVAVGQIAWDQMPDIQRTEGLGLTSRKVILTDCANAQFVYTRLVTQIEEWDALFRQAFVMMMAVALAPTAIMDRKTMVAERERMIPVLKNAIADARVANGNEAGNPQSTDFVASFIRARSQGPWGWDGYGGALAGGSNGMLGCGWDQMSWSGNVF